MNARSPHQLRATRIERFPTAAPGSVIITQGNTRVLCTASLDELPKWLKAPGGSSPPGASLSSSASAGKPASGEEAKGWVTAEYAMLPGSTTQRKKRGPDSRGTEIQRLIGRSLRAAVDLTLMPGIAITCDCDVLEADGGTRTASITGAFVALADCLAHARRQGLVRANPLRGQVAAVSVGIIDGRPMLDLDYSLDVRAEVDMNVVMNHRGDFVEVQGTAEGAAFSRRQLDQLLALAGKGIRRLMVIQRQVMKNL